MAEVTGYSAARMKVIEDTTIVDGRIDGRDHLILYKRNGTQVDAGYIKGGTAEWIEEFLPRFEDSEQLGETNDRILGELKDEYHEFVGRVDGIDEIVQESQTKLEDLPQIQQDAKDAAQNALDSLALAQNSVHTIITYYAVSNSDVVAPTEGWTTGSISRGPGQTIWWKQETRNSNHVLIDTTTPAPFTGDRGDKGDPGQRGLQGIQGDQGTQGVPGQKGVDGLTSYTHIAYADAADGSGFSQTPDNKTYIGIYVDHTEVDSNIPSAYHWSLIKGADGSQGIPGKAGTDGKTPYFHVAWSTAQDGSSGFSTTVSAGKTYLGTYTDFVAADSTDATKYSWSLIKGEQGVQGLQGIPGVKGSDGVTTYTWMKYATSSTGAGMSDTPEGKTYVGFAYNKTTAMESNTPGDYIWSLIQGPKGDQGNQGVQGNQGIPGIKGTDGTQYYTWLKYADTPTTGMSDSPTGKTYMGIAVNKTTATESNVYSDYSWSLIKGDKGDQGIQGDRGIQGLKGTDGTQYYTWIKYADSPTTGMSDLPTGKKYMGIAVNKTTATESTVYGDYSWSLIEGPQGTQGGVGQKGADGITTYTWIKYGTSAVGAGMSDSPTGKTYIGFAYNKTTATESNTPGDYIWSLIQGPKGDQGNTGASASQITPYYRQLLSSSLPPLKPTTKVPTDWSEQEPDPLPDTSLYRTELVEFSDNTFHYTPVTLVSSYTASSSAMYVANLAQQNITGLVWISPTEPPHAMRVPGQIWLKTGPGGTKDGVEFDTIQGIYHLVSPVPLVAEWQLHATVTGILIIPGDPTDPNSLPTVIDQNGMIIGVINGHSITGKVIAAETLTAEHFVVGVRNTIDHAASWAKRVEITPDHIIIAQGKASDSGGPSTVDTMMKLTSTRLSFSSKGGEVAYIDSTDQMLSIRQAVVQESIRIGDHLFRKADSGTGITIIQPVT